MESNRDLDVALAKALGWRLERDDDFGMWHLVDPSSDPDLTLSAYTYDAPDEETAWKELAPFFQEDWDDLSLLIEAMRRPPHLWHCRMDNESLSDQRRWLVAFYKFGPHTGGLHCAEDAPMAGAIAAARALGIEVPS